MNYPVNASVPLTGERLRQTFQHYLGFEVIPFKRTREALLAHVLRQVSLTITASPAKGQDATIDLAVE